ncbi:uncharacterized protein B0H18DRAFT_1026412 [Fomitopsis serialis]|uniref:uncharacterized protein n=1 Tax=Fomitopsis serialis TaxID=139415 RepID=UPI0020081337|nr:uncharacterized protein B0H18DRAFT_1026412 [Neoantrodia serialis]KAH9919836.1 hypothetical protein B0H18DRAFT_1026412 [Neoantrodia serialis]
MRTAADDGSWTWFEAGKEATLRRAIARDEPASEVFRTRRVQWDAALPDDDFEVDAELHEWMGCFTSGDELSVFALARFNGWANYVRRVVVELYCACV